MTEKFAEVKLNEVVTGVVGVEGPQLFKTTEYIIHNKTIILLKTNIIHLQLETTCSQFCSLVDLTTYSIHSQ